MSSVNLPIPSVIADAFRGISCIFTLGRHCPYCGSTCPILGQWEPLGRPLSWAVGPLSSRQLPCSAVTAVSLRLQEPRLGPLFQVPLAIQGPLFSGSGDEAVFGGACLPFRHKVLTSESAGHLWGLLFRPAGRWGEPFQEHRCGSGPEGTAGAPPASGPPSEPAAWQRTHHPSSGAWGRCARGGGGRGEGSTAGRGSQESAPWDPRVPDTLLRSGRAWGRRVSCRSVLTRVVVAVLPLTVSRPRHQDVPAVSVPPAAPASGPFLPAGTSTGLPSAEERRVGSAR